MILCTKTAVCVVFGFTNGAMLNCERILEMFHYLSKDCFLSVKLVKKLRFNNLVKKNNKGNPKCRVLKFYYVHMIDTNIVDKRWKVCV